MWKEQMNSTSSSTGLILWPRPLQDLRTVEAKGLWHLVSSSAAVTHLLQGLCVQRWCSAYLGCNKWLFELLLPFPSSQTSRLISSDLWHQNGVFVHTTTAHWIFSLSWTIPCEPQRWLCVKIPIDQQFLKYSDQPVWHQQPCHVQSHLNPLSSASHHHV